MITQRYNVCNGNMGGNKDKNLVSQNISKKSSYEYTINFLLHYDMFIHFFYTFL